MSNPRNNDRKLYTESTPHTRCLQAAIIESFIGYVKLYCLEFGYTMDANLIRLTALTGAAATQIKGNTTHKNCKLSHKSVIKDEDQQLWTNTRILVVDEISFGGYEDFLQKLSKNLQLLTQEDEILFGSVPIVFIGDFFQLEPTCGKAIYKFPGSLYWEQELNMMVELQGKWRYKDCPILQDIFPIYRKFGLTDEVRQVFNSRVIGNGLANGGLVELPDISKVKVCTWTNKKKETFNELIFMEHLRKHHSKIEADKVPDFTVIVKGHLSYGHRDFTFKERNNFFSNCTESDTRLSSSNSKRMAPLLKLFHKCQMMGIENEDVAKGIANGTTAIFQYIKLRQGKRAHKIKYNGYWVYAVNAEDIEFMKLSWTEDSTFKGDFTIAPKAMSCVSTITVKEAGRTEKLPWNVKLMQFMLTVNHATTGHKLQGKSVDSLIVGEWAKNVRNWIYVVLSRVRTIDGLFLLQELPNDVETAPDPMVIGMLDRLRQKVLFKGDSDVMAIRRSSITL